MPFHRLKNIWLAALVCGVAFAALFAVRVDLVKKIFQRPQNAPQWTGDAPLARDTWMTISQGGRKIGFSHSTFSKVAEGFQLNETLFMRINTMGMIHDINLKTEGVLNADYSLASFDFDMSSGRFAFHASGSYSNDVFSVTTQSAGGPPQSFDIDVQDKPYLAAGILDAVRGADLKTGDKLTFHVFDPATMGQERVHVRVKGEEDIQIMGRLARATVLIVEFKGVRQTAWIGENGELLKESGFLGIVLEKSTRRQALFDLALEESQDLTKVAAIASNVTIHNPQDLDRLTVRLVGISLAKKTFGEGRQSLDEDRLTVQKESLSDLPGRLDLNNLEPAEKRLLAPGPFVQSDHPKIVSLVNTIVADADAPLEKVQKLMTWIDRHVEKRPVISIPDALSILENRIGDCNEHAVLMAALSRAAGIPATIEAGIVYLDGRFYYHAWNLVYLGRWITVDALFGQLPADVTHLCFSRGGPGDQLEMMDFIGNVSIEVVSQEFIAPKKTWSSGPGQS
jgi:Transglutaminase-like superfamily